MVLQVRWLTVGLVLVGLVLAGMAALLGAGRYLLRRLRSPELCRQHQWTQEAAVAGWRCGRCGAGRPDCPHLTWEFVLNAESWVCRACGARRAAAAWPAAAEGAG